MLCTFSCVFIDKFNICFIIESIIYYGYIKLAMTILIIMSYRNIQ